MAQRHSPVTPEMENISVAAPALRLNFGRTMRPWSEGRASRGGYVPLELDPGCRQLVITGPLVE